MEQKQKRVLVVRRVALFGLTTWTITQLVNKWRSSLSLSLALSSIHLSIDPYFSFIALLILRAERYSLPKIKK